MKASEKHALKMAKKDHKLSKSTDMYQVGRQEILKAIVDGIKHCNFGSLRINVERTL